MAGDALVMACKNGNTDIVSLLQNGVFPDLLNSLGLIAASISGHTKIVELLLSHGAQVDLRTHGGMSALMMAVVEGHTEIVQFLLEYGVQVDLQDNSGNSALYAYMDPSK